MAVKTQKRQTMQTTTRQPRQSPAQLGGQQQGQLAKVLIQCHPQIVNSLTSFREEMSKPKRNHYIPDGIKVVY